MKILIIGAKLQGIEAIYLAKHAKYEVTVIDKNATAPGMNLADYSIVADIFDFDAVKDEFNKTDIILPAIENIDVINKIFEIALLYKKKVIFDRNAYKISNSKELSNEMFRNLKLPMPNDYPECKFPVVLKPDGLSGSAGVIKAYSKKEVEEYLIHNAGQQTVIQEFLDGRSYSLEVLGNGQQYFPVQITEVVVDDDYDCKRIIAPAVISDDLKSQMFDLGNKLAEAIKINGIFDIEVIDDNGTLKLLEIDARLPSQTPISVYHSTGINMLELLVNIFSTDDISEITNDVIRTCEKESLFCYYQQVEVKDGNVKLKGEHIMGNCKKLYFRNNFFGADEAITDYDLNNKDWKAIVIITRPTQKEACEAFDDFVRQVSLQGR